MTPWVVDRKNGQHYRVLLSGGVSLFLIGRSLLSRLDGDRSLIAIGILLFIGTVMLLLLINSIRALLDKRPALIVDAQGVHDFVSSARPGLIPWSNIKEVAAKRLSGTDVIAVMLHDDAGILENVSGFRRSLTENSLKRTGSPIALPVKFMDARQDELLRVLSEGLQQKR